MTLDENARILCFGDSNTWGQNDDKNYGDRYPIAKRWTGILQRKLGSRFDVHEEAIGGRNTDIEHYNPKKSGRNGLDYFKTYISSHEPFDLIVIMLGTNDVKVQYDRSPADVGRALKRFIELANQVSGSTKILLISPPLIDASAPKFDEYYNGVYDQVAADKSRKLGKEIERVANKAKCYFLDVADAVTVGQDGLHLPADEHKKMAEVVYDKLQEILK